LTQVISLKEIPNAAEDILSGKVLGRIVVDLNL
jgi:D-arabinose 1-dehydrogenase-like Zn-dependent alcohol dehydrogenase